MPMKFSAFAVILALAACAPTTAEHSAEALPACADIELSRGELTPAQCQLQAAGQTLRVTYNELPAGVQGGNVSIDVLAEDGSVQQTLLEPDVSEYLPVSIDDIDGDGRADILVGRVGGNVNTEHALWLYNGERARYERVGEVSGVSIERTGDGYLAVPARSGAASWGVAFYRLDEGGLHPLVTLQIDGEETASGAIRSTCTLLESPGLRDLSLSEAAAREKFCAEPAAQVFGP